MSDLSRPTNLARLSGTFLSRNVRASAAVGDSPGEAKVDTADRRWHRRCSSAGFTFSACQRVARCVSILAASAASSSGTVGAAPQVKASANAIAKAVVARMRPPDQYRGMSRVAVTALAEAQRSRGSG